MPIGRIVDPIEALFSNLSKDREMLSVRDDGSSQILGNPIHLKGVSLRYQRPPRLGEDNVTILSKLGYTSVEIEELERMNIIGRDSY